MTLNPKEAPKGYRAVEYEGCSACAFNDLDWRSCAYKSCICSTRKDGCDVHFIKMPKAKRTKPRRKPHVAWVVTADANYNGVDWQYCVAYRSRSLARGHIAHMRKLGWSGMRGPVKAVLP